MEPATGATDPQSGAITDAQATEFLSNSILEAVMGSFMMKKIQEAAAEFREEE
jgi:hypothetical protein